MTMRKELTATELKEKMCNRMRLLWEASGMRKGKFAERIGLSPTQLTNIFRYRNPPPRASIANAVREFGVTSDFFYTGDRAGMRDPALPDKLRQAADKLNIAD